MSLPQSRPLERPRTGPHRDLLRWINDPPSRDFDLDDLIVVTAMTSDEFASTASDVEDIVLPQMRRHGIRYVQVGRNKLHTSSAGDGITVVSDTTEPTTLHTSGDYRLSDEMLSAATVPQLGGSRRCSARSKGAALKPVIGKLTAGLPYRHYIGFEANEQRRATKDRLYNTSIPWRRGARAQTIDGITVRLAGRG